MPLRTIGDAGTVEITMMVTTNCPSVDELRALASGQLADEQSEDLWGHVRECGECRSELETVDDGEDSLIVSLRDRDDQVHYDDEPGCKLAVVKALGALALANETSAASESELLPKMFGEYEIVRPLGRGGMGSVFLARHTKLGREVALKILTSHRLADPRMRQRFEAEMRAIGKLSHPNIVTAHDARDVEGTAVLVTEYIGGLDLGQLVARTGPLAVADACELIRQVSLALQYTSDQGFVHRDVKPSNIMLSDRGEVKLLDLGLARFQHGEESSEMTGTGQTMGTADYVAPEQVTDSRSVDVRADIYSLGCTLFKLLTGTAPFADQTHVTAFAKMTAHVSKQPPSLAQRLPGAPAGLVKLVNSMLAKQPSQRPQAPMDVAQALVAFTRGNDLQRLYEQAAAIQPAMASRAAGTAPVSIAAQPQSLLRRRIPVSVAIASGLLGVLLGFALGIVITITKPDGSKMTLNVPNGSSIDIRNSEGSDQAAAESMVTPSNQAGADPMSTSSAGGVSLPSQPLNSQSPVSPLTSSDALEEIKRKPKQIGIAFHNFHDVHKKFPGSANLREGGRDATGKYPFSWRVALLPFLGHDDLFEQYHFDEPWDSEYNLTLLNKMPDVYRLPGRPSGYLLNTSHDGRTCFQGIVGSQTALGAKTGEPMTSFIDGLSNTLLVWDAAQDVQWTEPRDISFESIADVKRWLRWRQSREFAPTYPEWIFSYLLADGSVRTMPLSSIDAERFTALITRDGQEPVDP